MYPYAIYAAVFFMGIPYAAILPLTALFANSLGASYFEVGVITAAFSFIPFLMAVHMGRLIDRYGIFRGVVVGFAGMVAALLLPVCFPALPVLFLTLLFFGAFQTIAVVALQNGAASSVSAERRGRSVANFSLAASFGLFAGPLTAGYAIDFFGYIYTYLVLACVAFIPMLLVKRIGSAPRLSGQAAVNDEASKTKLWSELTGNRILFRSILISMVTLTAVDLFIVYFPLVGSVGGLTASQIGWVIAMQGIASILVRFAMPSILERFGYSGTLFGFILIGAIACGLLPFFNHLYMFGLLALLFGFGLGITQPITITLTFNNAPKGRTAEVLGLRIGINRLAQMTLPVALSAVSQFAGLASIFVTISVLLVGAAVNARGIRSAEESGVEGGEANM